MCFIVVPTYLLQEKINSTRLSTYCTFYLPTSYYVRMRDEIETSLHVFYILEKELEFVNNKRFIHIRTQAIFCMMQRTTKCEL